MQRVSSLFIATIFGIGLFSVSATAAASAKGQLYSTTRHALRVLGQRAKRAERAGRTSHAAELRNVRTTLRDLISNTWRQGKRPAHQFTKNGNPGHWLSVGGSFEDHRTSSNGNTSRSTPGQLHIHQDGSGASQAISLAGKISGAGIVTQGSKTARLRGNKTAELRYELNITRSGVEFEVWSRSGTYPDRVKKDIVPR